MKQSSKCPKCAGREILRIEGVVGPSGNGIPTGGFLPIKVARYVCAGCGFTEEWIESPDDLKRLRDMADRSWNPLSWLNYLSGVPRVERQEPPEPPPN